MCGIDTAQSLFILISSFYLIKQLNEQKDKEEKLLGELANEE
jgi:hypothetical protein